MKTDGFEKGFLIFLLLVSAFVPATAQHATDSNKVPVSNNGIYPVPERIPDMLFYLQRSLDQNSVIYQANYIQSGAGRQLDLQKPVHIYWLLNDESRSTRALTSVQRLGYGVRTEELGEDMVQLYLVAYKKMPIQLKYSPRERRYNAHIALDGKEVILRRVFINIDGGTKLKPNVTFIELSGTTLEGNRRITHRFKP